MTSINNPQSAIRTSPGLFKYYAAAYLGVVMTAVSQLCFKLGADRSKAHGVLSVFTNPYSVAAYGMLFAVTLLNLFAYRRLPLKISVVVLPFTYILVGLFSFVFLKERVSAQQLLGAGVIILGIVVFNVRRD